MKTSLKPGLSRTETLTIDSGRCIQFLGEDAQVYSTPDMISDMEYACLRLIDEHLDDTESSVGVLVHLEHLAGTICGEPVEVIVQIDKIEGAKIYLSAEVRDRIELLGRGEHIRYVINRQRHAKGLENKRQQLQSL
jgi:fluoroacetyl-CoA thioesterase